MSRGTGLLFLGPRRWMGRGSAPKPRPPLPPGKTRYPSYRMLLLSINHYNLQHCILNCQSSTTMFPKLLCSRSPFQFRIITTNPHTRAHENIASQDEMYPKLKIFILEVIFDSYEYIPIVHTTIKCMTLP